MTYLNNAYCCKTITVEDLNNVMSWSMNVTNENQSNNDIKALPLSVQLADEKDPIQYQIPEGNKTN